MDRGRGYISGMTKAKKTTAGVSHLCLKLNPACSLVPSFRDAHLRLELCMRCTTFLEKTSTKACLWKNGHCPRRTHGHATLGRGNFTHGCGNTGPDWPSALILDCDRNPRGLAAGNTRLGTAA